jgi:hypothetical protein
MKNANLCCTAATVRFKGAIKQNTHLVLSQNDFTHENIFSQGRVDGHKAVVQLTKASFPAFKTIRCTCGRAPYDLTFLQLKSDNFTIILKLLYCWHPPLFTYLRKWARPQVQRRLEEQCGNSAGRKNSAANSIKHVPAWGHLVVNAYEATGI